MFSKDFVEFIGLLNKNDVQYLIVGGYAVGLHGYPRYTGDLDIWILPQQENATKVLAALRDFGFGSLNISLEDLTKENNVIQLGYPPFRIDLMTSIDGVNFSDCYTNRKEIVIEGLTVNFIGYDDLIKNKKASGRHQDLGDIDNLK
ncbi:MAG: hypothetical protein C4308_06420 [Chitinophagaceae bacterium]